MVGNIFRIPKWKEAVDQAKKVPETKYLYDLSNVQAKYIVTVMDDLLRGKITNLGNGCFLGMYVNNKNKVANMGALEQKGTDVTIIIYDLLSEAQTEFILSTSTPPSQFGKYDLQETTLRNKALVDKLQSTRFTSTRIMKM